MVVELQHRATGAADRRPLRQQLLFGHFNETGPPGAEHLTVGKFGESERGGSSLNSNFCYAYISNRFFLATALFPNGSVSHPSLLSFSLSWALIRKGEERGHSFRRHLAIHRGGGLRECPLGFFLQPRLGSRQHRWRCAFGSRTFAADFCACLVRLFDIISRATSKELFRRFRCICQ